MNLFETAAQMLLDVTNKNAGERSDSTTTNNQTNLNQAACEFLARLNYLSIQQNGKPTAISTERTTVNNQLALLKLASQFDQAFELPMSHTPGVAFFGGILSPTTFGLNGHDPVGAAGRGLNFRQAFESCVGEAAEFMSFIEWNKDPLLVQLDIHNGLNNSQLEWSLDGIGAPYSTNPAELDWVQAQSLLDQNTVCFPSELILRRPAHHRNGRRAAESNGVGAGPTINHALYAGLMEVIERDAIALWWYGGHAPSLPNPKTLQNANISTAIQKTRPQSSRQVRFLDLTSDIDVPVIAALSANSDGTAVVAGFNADINPAVATQRAFYEMCQMEQAQDLSRAKLETTNYQDLNDMDKVWIDRYENLNFHDFAQFDTPDTVRKMYQNDPPSSVNEIVQNLGKKHLTPYFIDLTRAPVGIPVARVLVPGLQSAKPDWQSKRLIEMAEKNGKDPAKFDATVAPI